MINLNLVDIWREKHENQRCNTWIGPHNKQGRLDYFLISTDLAQYIEAADIGIRYKSDHNPISVLLNLFSKKGVVGIGISTIICLGMWNMLT